MSDDQERERRGIGLQNTLERLRALYGNDYLFSIENRSPTGLAVTIRIPYRTAETPREAGGAA